MNFQYIPIRSGLGFDLSQIKQEHLLLLLSFYYVFLALYSEGEQPFCLWNNLLKYSGLLYPTMPAISFIE